MLTFDRQQFASLSDSVARDGWCVTSPLFSATEIDDVLVGLAPVLASDEHRAGVRNLLDHSEAVCTIARSTAVNDLAAAVLGLKCFAVRALLFDKTPDSNWKVPWHQDLTIAVASRLDATGFGPWSEKESVPHVQPPFAVLEQMLALRIHLDECGPNNGPLRVLSGSHRAGRLSADEIERCRATLSETQCLAQRGAVLAMRPLLLHASSTAIVPAHRRVLHLEFAAAELATLPQGLQWRWAV